MKLTSKMDELVKELTELHFQEMDRDSSLKATRSMKEKYHYGILANVAQGSITKKDILDEIRNIKKRIKTEA